MPAKVCVESFYVIIMEASENHKYCLEAVFLSGKGDVEAYQSVKREYYTHSYIMNINKTKTAFTSSLPPPPPYGCKLKTIGYSALRGLFNIYNRRQNEENSRLY